ncbi:MAG: hypothetical protein HY585_03970 [Candidatus Omnitrophica bacterium]|nr:hypothetical protein [Candidatus Omnitrophota bacterium]
MKKIETVIALFFLIASRISFSEEIPIRIDATVVRTDEVKRRLVVDHEIPATGERREVEFQVNEGAGFKDFKKLSDLKTGDLVSLDYLDHKPLPKAIYVMQIPLKKTYFTHKEIAEALTKVKTNQKDANVAKG